MRTILIAAFAATLATPAFADLQIRFDEGAPKDRFVIKNAGNCALTDAKLTIDLAGSPYGLIFDVTGRGAGVEVFQPFELAAGGAALKSQPIVRDGDNRLTLDFGSLPAGETLSFTIDVDDTVNNREITVSDAEIAGATVRLDALEGVQEVAFGTGASAMMERPACS